LDDYVDVLSMGKLTQACATLFRDEYVPKPNLVSQTFTASSSAIHAATVIVEELLKGKYLGKTGKIEQCSKRFIGNLEKISQRHPDWVKGPFGIGAMVGFTVFDGSAEVSRIFLKSLFEEGVLGFVAGKSPYRIRFLMPIGAVTPNDIDKVSAIIEKTIKLMKETHHK
jgi:4-aminobutyrate aminotransferase-like enzyme